MTQGVDDGVNKGDSLATGFYKLIEFCSQAVLRFIHKDFLLTEVILEKKKHSFEENVSQRAYVRRYQRQKTNPPEYKFNMLSLIKIKCCIIANKGKVLSVYRLEVNLASCIMKFSKHN